MVTVRQVMSDNVNALRPEMTVEEAIDFLTCNHIGGAPVVDGEGKLVGIISELALIDVVFDASVRFAPISRYMTTKVQTVGPDETLVRTAQLFVLHDFRRLPVVENARLVGTVSRRDLMNHALRTNQTIADPLISLIPSLAPMS